MYDLNSLLPSEFTTTLVQATAINDSGQIVANGNNGHSYLLSPVPVGPNTGPNFLFPLSTLGTGTSVELTTAAGGSSVSCGAIVSDSHGHCTDYENPTLSQLEISALKTLNVTQDYYKQKLALTHGYYDVYHDVAHFAMDFALDSGTAMVIANKAGTVVAVTGQSGSKCAGTMNCIVIDNGNGYFTEYREFSAPALNAKTGEPFKATDPIDEKQQLGTLVAGPGNHLHLQIMTGHINDYNSSASNPALAGVTVGGRLFKDYKLNGTITHPLKAQIYGQTIPQLPTQDKNSDAYKFNIVVGELGVGKSLPIYVDPVFAVGYDFQIASGPNFASVILPNVGDGEFALWLWDSILGNWVFDETLTHDIQFFFGGGGVDRFRILGIETGAGLDPNDPQAFVTGLTFVENGTVDMTMTAITTNAPEPPALSLLALGLVALGFSRRTIGVGSL